MEPKSSLPYSQQSCTSPYLSQVNPVHTTPPHLFKIYFNIILPPTFTSS
jgi:hypothetical protein